MKKSVVLFSSLLATILELKNDLINTKTTLKGLKSNRMIKVILDELKTGSLSKKEI